MIRHFTVFTEFWKPEKFSLSFMSHYICISKVEFLFLIFPSGGLSMCMTSSASSHFCAWWRTSQSCHYTTFIICSQTSGYYFVRPSDRSKFFHLFFFKLTKLLPHIWLIIVLGVFESLGKCWGKSIKELDC